MIKLMLNLHKFNNYAFFCPVSRLHLTVSSPVGYANEVTTAILKALKAETVLDVDGVVDIETGTVKAVKQELPAQEKAPVQKNPEPNVEDKQESAPVMEESSEAPAETPAEEKPKKGGKKAAPKADAE